ncbi:MAG TPA: pyridoxamine 5'-phosphate oxidase [Devosia sp.]|nr:pyridoxamine 5'-phosphate oxidase [Sphingomonadaceae bacterium]HTO27412.1 pyridoxamine 5'-phosphate oxidase [Devosia sp.]
MKAEQDAIPETDPFALFDVWYADARASEPNDSNAMALATATPEGVPSVRMVLLKGWGADLGGFVFYTNTQSRKGGEILANPVAALLFHWKSLRRQIRIEGPLTQVSARMADDYFHSRPRVSQIGSAASDQSRPLDARTTYLSRVEEMSALYPEGTEIPRPPHWTGFLLKPRAIEFWIDRPNRLHERRRFVHAEDGGWSSSLLYP